MNFFSLLLAFLVFGHHSYADSDSAAASRGCTTVDMRLPGGSMHGAPITDQDGLSICYAYSAAQIADAWRRKFGDKNTRYRASPFAVAAWTAAKVGSSSVEHGIGFNALNQIREEGTCDQEVILGQQTSLAVGQKFKDITESFHLYHRLGNLKFNPTRSGYRPSPENAANRRWEAANAISCAMPSMINGLPDNTDAVLDALEEPTESRFWKRALDVACREKITKLPGFPEPRIINTTRVEGIHTALNRSGGLPFLINYCSKILTEVPPYPRHYDDDSKCNRHESLIIGRKMIRGACHFLVRNSWGTGCLRYEEAGWRCEGGDIWVRAEDLSRNSQTATYLGSQ